jgi:hypothetical protein
LTHHKKETARAALLRLLSHMSATFAQIIGINLNRRGKPASETLDGANGK